MKKFLLSLLGGALFCLPTLAQEEDVTHYIQNAGFDEDLTFQVDGTMKEAVSTETSLSNRSWAYIAADSTVYARPNASSSQNRPDGRKMEAVNGFKGRVQGWTMESNSNFPQCEWTYFGSVPYDLVPQSVPIADDGSTYLEVPARPTEFDGGVGFVYLRAGWTNSALYKQVVNLPCAKYRLEYWTININPNTSAVAADLTKIVCRKDVFQDEEGTGLQAQEWTKHEFEFTPTAEFTMQFGYQAANAGSGGQPIVALDGIKLYKIGDADPFELLRSDLNDLSQECQQLALEAAQNGFTALSAQIDDYSMAIDDFDGGQAELEASLKEANAMVALFKEALAEMPNFDAILAKMDNLLSTTDYAGKDAFDAAYKQILSYKEDDSQEGVNIAELIKGAVEEGNNAIKAYYLTQPGSEENPADFTIFIKNPWFITTSAEPTLVDGVWVFPNNIEKEDGTMNYSVGSGSSPDLTSDGWYVAGAGGGDQRLNWQQGRSCWNAWNNNFTTTVAVAQDIEGLPNGYYTVSADLITQAGYANGTQKVFAQSIAEKKTSTAALTSEGEGWDDADPSAAQWQTVSMTAEDKVLVVDGKLTIGAEGTGDGNASAGWFLATNFHLYYLGEAPADAVQAALRAKVSAASDYAEEMHFAADKKALQDSIAKFVAVDDYVEALAGLTAAMTEAEKSEAKYEEYIPADGTIEGKTIPTVQFELTDGDGYGAAKEIMQFAYNYTMSWIASETATYTEFDAVVDQLKNYLNTYTPAYNNAAEVASASSAAGKTALQEMMNEQKAILISEMQNKETIDAFVTKLNTLIGMVEKRNTYDNNPDATDFTAFIQNPNAEAEAGWVFDKGNGNTNTTSGQWFDGSGTRYFDSYNAGGLQGYIAKQLITDLPNGTYTVGVYTRTPAEGAYVFCAPAADTTWVEIPMNYHNTYTEAGEDTTVVASDQYGPIWEDARVKVEDEGISPDAPDYDLVYAIYDANTGKGRGWQHQEIANVVVTNHELLIGTAAGSEALGTPKTFGGAWYSVGGWTLTLTAKGDNSGWEGPVISGIENVTVAKAADGIYSLTGVKSAKMQRGINIVVVDGKARKVIVK